MYTKVLAYAKWIGSNGLWIFYNFVTHSAPPSPFIDLLYQSSCICVIAIEMISFRVTLGSYWIIKELPLNIYFCLAEIWMNVKGGKFSLATWIIEMKVNLFLRILFLSSVVIYFGIRIRKLSKIFDWTHKDGKDNDLLYYQYIGVHCVAYISSSFRLFLLFITIQPQTNQTKK